MSILFADIFEAILTLRVCKGTSEKEILNYVQERAGGCLSVNNKMFNYKYPLLEVVQAIEHLQESKGTTNTQVCEFVRKMAKKPNDPMKVLKTVCTLNKLVDEGVLIKKGRRYSLPKPPPKRDDDDDMEQEEEKDDECDEDDDEDMKDSCDDLGGDDEEDCPEGGDDDNNDDDDDDDDDEDDDDDDDDDDEEDQCMNKDDEEDDDNCNDKTEDDKSKEEKKDDCPEGEGEDEVDKQATGNVNGGANGSGGMNEGGRLKPGSGELTCTTSFEKNFGSQKHPSTKKSKRYSAMITKAENVAFCARDFMDSQYRSLSDGPGKMEDVMEEDQEVNEKSKEIANIFQARRRGSRSRQSHLSNPNYRSRSPVKGAATDAMQHRLAMEPSDEIGPLSNYQEAGDMDLDIEPNRHEGFDLYNRRSPVNPHLPGVSAGQVSRRESLINTQDKKEIKPEPVMAASMNLYGLKKQADTALSALKGKEGKSKKEAGDAKKDKHKREASYSKKIDDGKKSVCSVCDKKKRKKNF